MGDIVYHLVETGCLRLTPGINMSRTSLAVCTKHGSRSSSSSSRTGMRLTLCSDLFLGTSPGEDCVSAWEVFLFFVAGSSLPPSVRHGSFSSNSSAAGELTNAHLSNMKRHASLHAQLPSPNKVRHGPLPHASPFLSPPPLIQLGRNILTLPSPPLYFFLRDGLL